MIVEDDSKEKSLLGDGAQIEERVLPQPYRSRSSIMREKVKLQLQEYKLSKTRQGPVNTVNVRIKKPQRNIAKQSCSPEEAYRFFCHKFNGLERNEPPTETQKRGNDTAINIEDVVECHNPLVPGEIVNLDVDPNLIFVPSDLPVCLTRTIPGNMKPRFMEDEGLFVCERPHVPWKMINKMENRLIEQEKCWFGENGHMIALPDPIQKYWRCKVDFPFSSQSPCLTTEYHWPVTLGSGGASVSDAEGSAGQWQLDLNLVGLVFTHHPLFSSEHVLAQRLIELYEHYHTRQVMGATASLQDKLRGLKRSEINLTRSDETRPAAASKLRDLRQEIRKTNNALNNERQVDLCLMKKMLGAWKRIKALRVKNGYVNTTVKLQLQRVTARVTDSTTHSDGADKHMGSVNTENTGDITIKQHYVCKELNRLEEEDEEDEEETELQPRQDEMFDPANHEAEHLELIPVLTMSGMLSPTSSCAPDEKVRRYELSNHKVSVNIFYNGKHVSTSEPAMVHNDFRVDIQQLFNMLIVHSPENIMLEICELVKNKSTLLAKVYVPIPDRNMLSSIAAVERSEFSSDQVVKAYYEGVGSNVPFRLTGEDAELCLLTSGRLLFGVSWAVDESGFPMAPAAPQKRPSFTRAIASCTNESRLTWIRDLQFDPNHPANTELTELLREACEQRDKAAGHFRLQTLEEEFDFSTKEQLEKSRRFDLLQLRSSHAVDISPAKPIPLHDGDITEAMFKDYSGSLDLSLKDEDPITAQRACSVHYIQKVLNLARNKMLNIKRRYKFSDIVTEYQDTDTVMEFNWDMFRRMRPLNPKRIKRNAIPTSTLSDGDLKIHVRINNAMGLPIRQEAFLKEIHTREPCCGLTSSRHNMRCSSERIVQARIQPFVEVKFQETTYESSIEQGPNPSWREEFILEFKSTGGDYSHAGLSKIEDNIIINVFDEISFQVIESSSLRGCGTQVFSGKQWLGSVTLPFRSLLQQSEVYGDMNICNPLILLGYTWTEDSHVTDQGKQMDNRTPGQLGVLITLNPPISLSDDLTAKDGEQKPLWLFPTNEAQALLDLTYEFEKECKAAGRGKNRVITTVINSEGRLVLANRFFRPLPPPQEVLQHLPNSSASVLERVAAFVSLIPTLSFPSDVGDSGDMWFTSEQCLELVIGNDVSLAVLLCNFFHYLNVEAWLLLGTSVIEGRTAYVLTKESAEYVVWNPRDGKHYQPDYRLCPLRTVDCLANGQNVWFHFQPKREKPITFNLSENATWKPLFPKGFKSDTSSKPTEIRYHPCQMDFVNHLQRQMEMKLKSSVMDWRSPHPTRWNPRCSAMLVQVLQKLERNHAPLDTELEIDRVLHAMRDYKVTGFPINLAYQDMHKVIKSVFNTRIHSTEIPGVEFALAIYIHPYANHILSVWIFLATLVKHQHGVYYVPAVQDY